MIDRIAVYILVIILLVDLYIDKNYLQQRYLLSRKWRLLYWLITIGMVIYTLCLAFQPNFAPDNLTWLYTYLFLLISFVATKVLFCICTLVGEGVRRFIYPTKYNFGEPIGLFLSIAALIIYIYGVTIGFSSIRVKHIDLSFTNLPPAFEGYRIVHISDLHLGTFDDWRSGILTAEMDSIAKQSPNLICFTGDLQNQKPEEIEKMIPLIHKTLKGTIAVLGNHDYAKYVKTTALDAKKQVNRTILVEKEKLGWTLLRNAHTCIYAIKDGKKDSIFICGTENDGQPPFPSYANYKQATNQIPSEAFIIMLQHDPSAWQRAILKQTKAQLTLSGHTHGGQMQIGNWRPTHIKLSEDYGLYEHNSRLLYVTAGLGGLVPFRLNMPNEITVITLHKKK